jgi:hypothetical protein
MGAMGRIREYWGQLRGGPPGLRFKNFYAYRHRRRGDSRWERILTLVIGVTLVIAGLAVGWLPGPGGFIAVIGGALLASEWLPIARALDWSEVRIRRAVRWLCSSAREA